MLTDWLFKWQTDGRLEAAVQQDPDSFSGALKENTTRVKQIKHVVGNVAKPLISRFIIVFSSRKQMACTKCFSDPVSPKRDKVFHHMLLRRMPIAFVCSPFNVFIDFKKLKCLSLIWVFRSIQSPPWLKTNEASHSSFFYCNNTKRKGLTQHNFTLKEQNIGADVH